MPSKSIQQHKHEGKDKEKNTGAAAQLSPTSMRNKGRREQGIGYDRENKNLGQPTLAARGR